MWILPNITSSFFINWYTYTQHTKIFNAYIIYIFIIPYIFIHYNILCNKFENYMSTFANKSKRGRLLSMTLQFIYVCKKKSLVYFLSPLSDNVVVWFTFILCSVLTIALSCYIGPCILYLKTSIKFNNHMVVLVKIFRVRTSLQSIESWFIYIFFIYKKT
jgi:hypothetical protein